MGVDMHQPREQKKAGKKIATARHSIFVEEFDEAMGMLLANDIKMPNHLQTAGKFAMRALLSKN
jgi:hypothetical protein